MNLVNDIMWKNVPALNIISYFKPARTRSYSNLHSLVVYSLLFPCLAVKAFVPFLEKLPHNTSHFSSPQNYYFPLLYCTSNLSPAFSSVSCRALIRLFYLRRPFPLAPHPPAPPSLALSYRKQTTVGKSMALILNFSWSRTTVPSLCSSLDSNKLLSKQQNFTISQLMERRDATKLEDDLCV